MDNEDDVHTRDVIGLNRLASHWDDAIIPFVNNLFLQAFQQSASDIHIEPFASHCRIRLRCHGLLQELTSVPLEYWSRLITRLKIMANLDIAERRLPQDGRLAFKMTEQTSLDIRLNTCPTLHGEKIVLRLFHHETSLSLAQLGMTEIQQTLFLEKISAPQGLILITGPTGSGKTLTLYTALRYLNTIEKNIATVEDPIEIPLPGVNQIPVHPKIGLDFAAALRTILRQDPDIIMIGEIRDRETADIAIKAAQTGHLVFSTLHTNTAVDALNRLQSFGLSSEDIASALTLVVAQRLLRRCHPTSQNDPGRIGIYELLPLTSDSINAFMKNHSHLRPFCTLRSEAFARYQEGITSQEEIDRVLGKDFTGTSL